MASWRATMKWPVSMQGAGRWDFFAGVKWGALLGLVVATGMPLLHRTEGAPAVREPITAGSAANAVSAPKPRRAANFSGAAASSDVRFVADWIAGSGDNGELSFVIIDKKNARIFVFNPAASLLGSTPVLLGAARGDDSVIGIGSRPISQVRPEERTTPAGRFRAEPGRNTSGEDVVWVDYDAAVSMHRVRVVDPKERRLERLATATSEDNRISYGCVNVPVNFYETLLGPLFRSRYGMVYVLPDIKPLREVFPSAYEAGEKYGGSNAAVRMKTTAGA